MKLSPRLAALALAAISLPFALHAQESGFGKLDPSEPNGVTVDEITKKMGARETEFAAERQNYSFRRSAKIQTIADDNKVDGEYQMVVDVNFDKTGRQVESVVFAPQNTMERVQMSPSDLQDIEHKLPFVLTTEDLPNYNIKYIGKQKVDELDTYVLEAEPKETDIKKQLKTRPFMGRVWVDQQDFQIVLVNGKTPDDTRAGHEDLHPPFTTYYEQIDGKYWFPTYTKAEGNLHFAGGRGYMSQDVHLRAIVHYTNYKRFRATVRVLYDGQDITNNGDEKNKPATSTPPASNPKK